MAAASCTQSRAAFDSEACPDYPWNNPPGSQGGRPSGLVQPPGATQDPPAERLQPAARILGVLEKLRSCNALLWLQRCLSHTCSRPDPREGSSAQGATAAVQALAAVGGALEAALQAAALQQSQPSLQPSPELLQAVAQSGVQLAAFATWHRKAAFQAAQLQELRSLARRPAPGDPKLACLELHSDWFTRRAREVQSQKLSPDTQLTPVTAHIAAAAAGVLSCAVSVDVPDDSLAGSTASTLGEVLLLLTASPPSLHGVAMRCCLEASAALAAAAGRSSSVRQRLAGADGDSWADTAELLQRWLLGDAEQDRRRPPSQQQQQAAEHLARVSWLIPAAPNPPSGAGQRPPLAQTGTVRQPQQHPKASPPPVVRQRRLRRPHYWQRWVWLRTSHCLPRGPAGARILSGAKSLSKSGARLHLHCDKPPAGRSAIPARASGSPSTVRCKRDLLCCVHLMPESMCPRGVAPGSCMQEGAVLVDAKPSK